MQARFTVRADKISPDLAKKIRAAKSPRPVLQAAGLQIVSMAKRAFTDSALRPTPWAPRKDPRKTHSLLRKTGTLWQSIGIKKLTDKSVSAGTDRPYGSVHQLGSRKATGRGGGIPPRPYLPFTRQGQLTPLAAQRIEAVMRAKLNSLFKP